MLVVLHGPPFQDRDEPVHHGVNVGLRHRKRSAPLRRAERGRRLTLEVTPAVRRASSWRTVRVRMLS
jgi:hypothetical protein